MSQARRSSRGDLRGNALEQWGELKPSVAGLVLRRLRLHPANPSLLQTPPAAGLAVWLIGFLLIAGCDTPNISYKSDCEPLTMATISWCDPAIPFAECDQPQNLLVMHSAVMKKRCRDMTVSTYASGARHVSYGRWEVIDGHGKPLDRQIITFPTPYQMKHGGVAYTQEDLQGVLRDGERRVPFSRTSYQ